MRSTACITDAEAHREPTQQAQCETVQQHIEKGDRVRLHAGPPFLVLEERTILRSSVSSSALISPLSTRQRTSASPLPPKSRFFNSASTPARPRDSVTAGS